ncbi:MAG: integration host factor subunit beta [Omnitrophica bacterium RIFCSPLOWO2_02_FULL_45_16]|nr:MAG: integration host factor subunit beta [Omnitrophica bacterium RIFCSPHIGHO2_02_FULL_46_20]OGW93780.1 MAG: integration host factor subunit beta [Omnitrophica bacterium RIFCSPLOWO2_01_FULL_45_24]OGW94125.1 MAG: integration host factor subunit beta [Omnitrophica bacterium RIFCSPLOWO2_12_FULL_45_13]OGX00815.1 MAG: integration host factor subunit beta [Omnitrophica bacterium RIFCSPLOWO2_02_FULL_45_16]
MTKKEIVIKIAEETRLKQVDVKRIVQRTLDHIIDSLTKGETVELRNFGIFKVRSRKSRVGRNPRTGVTVPIPEKRIVSFKSGMIMKKKVMK